MASAKIYFCTRCGWRGKLRKNSMGYCPEPTCGHDSLMLDTKENRDLVEHWNLQCTFYNLISLSKNLLSLIRRNYQPN